MPPCAKLIGPFLSGNEGLVRSSGLDCLMDIHFPLTPFLRTTRLRPVYALSWASSGGERPNKSSIVHPSTFATRTAVSNLGYCPPDSHIVTVVRETPSLFANSLCDNPFDLRSSLTCIILSPFRMSIILTIYHTALSFVNIIVIFFLYSLAMSLFLTYSNMQR